MRLRRIRRAWDRLKVHPIGRVLGMRRRKHSKPGNQKKGGEKKGKRRVEGGREVDTYA